MRERDSKGSLLKGMKKVKREKREKERMEMKHFIWLRHFHQMRFQREIFNPIDILWNHTHSSNHIRWYFCSISSLPEPKTAPKPNSTRIEWGRWTQQQQQQQQRQKLKLNSAAEFVMNRDNHFMMGINSIFCDFCALYCIPPSTSCRHCNACWMRSSLRMSYTGKLAAKMTCKRQEAKSNRWMIQ